MLFLILIVKYIFRFRFPPKMAGLFRFRFFFGRKRKCIFGYFYFTAEKVKFIFGRPLVRTSLGTSFPGSGRAWQSNSFRLILR